MRCALLADQEATAGDGIAALGIQQGSDLKKSVIPGTADRDGTAAPGIQQGSDLRTPVNPGDAAKTSYRVAPKDVQSVRPHSKNANTTTCSGWHYFSLKVNERVCCNSF